MRKLWGGRFEQEPDLAVERLNNSLPFDQALWRQDIRASIAHAAMLGECAIVTAEEAAQLTQGLAAIQQGLENGDLTLPPDAEDIHTAVEALLADRLGAVAGKLHTARSRNDQVCADLRLYLRDECDVIREELILLERAILDLAKRETETIMPGYTHLQHAQPITLAHHAMAYFWMLDRDRERLSDARRRINRSPLGAGALAGTGFAIDRRQTAAALGFESVLENSIDAVSDRDFAVEFLSFASTLMMHLSRFAEDIVLWNSAEFGFISLHDSVTTGSSIMPQKKNPDVAELTRGKAGRVFGSLVALLTVMKGLPLSYNKDLQEDKEPLFDAAATLRTVLPAFRQMLSTASFVKPKMAEAATGDFSTATDLADYLVRQGMPFRQAHEVVGKVVQRCLSQGVALESLGAEGLKELLADAGQSLEPDVLTVSHSVATRNSAGGTGPTAVLQQVAAAEKALALN